MAAERENKKKVSGKAAQKPSKYLVRLSKFEVSSTTSQIAGSVEIDSLDKPLSSLRDTKIIPGKCAFCLRDETPVNDSRIIQDYLRLDNLISDKPVSETQQNEDDGEPSESPKTSQSEIITVFFRVPELRPEAPDTLTLPSRAGGDAGSGGGIGGLGGVPVRQLPAGQTAAAFDSNEWVTKAVSDASFSHPAALDEENWKSVIVTNALMHGLSYRKGHGVTRSRRPAFKLRKNLFNPYALEKNKNRYTDENVVMIGGIPEFQVFDDSSISIVETTNKLQSSMAKNGFDEWSVEASLSFDYGIVSGSAAAGGGEKNTTGQAAVIDTTSTELHANYKFPRVVTFFDELTMELNDECKTVITDICDSYEEEGVLPESINLFESHFGAVFAKCVHLGGRLHASKVSTFVAGTTESEKTSAMHASASVSFKAPGFKASASGSGASGTAEQQKEMTSRQDENLCWEAVGSDTTLVSNPPLWASTIADHKTWRVTMYHDIVPIQDLLALIPGGRRFKLVLDETMNGVVDPLLLADFPRPTTLEGARHFRIRNWKNEKVLTINRREGAQISVEETLTDRENGQFWFNNLARTPIPISFFDLKNSRKGIVDWSRHRIQWAGGATFAGTTCQKAFVLTRVGDDHILSSESNENGNNECYFRFCKSIYDICKPTAIKDNSKGFICIIRRGQPRFLSHSKYWTTGSAPFFTIEQVEAKEALQETDILFPAAFVLNDRVDGPTKSPKRIFTLPNHWWPDDNKRNSPYAFIDRGRSDMTVKFALDTEVTVSELATGPGLYFTTRCDKSTRKWTALLPPGWEQSKDWMQSEEWTLYRKRIWRSPKNVPEEVFESTNIEDTVVDFRQSKDQAYKETMTQEHNSRSRE